MPNKKSPQKSGLKLEKRENIGNGLLEEVERLTKELKDVKEQLDREKVEHQRAKEALEKSEARLDAALEKAPIALWEIDSKGWCVFVRERELESSWLRSHLAVGKPVFELCRGDRVLLENISLVLAGEGREWLWEVEDLVYETKVTPERDSSGKVVGARGVSIDITARHRSSAALQKAKEELEVKIEERTSALKESNDNLVEEIVKHKLAQKELQYRLNLESLLATLSTYLIDLDSAEIDNGIKVSLEWIGNFSEIDRSYVLLLEENRSYISNSHEWCTVGIASQINQRQKISLANLKQWENKVRTEEIIYIPNVAKMPKTEGRIKALLRSQSIKSLVLVPMLYCGNVMGVLGFESVRSPKTWSEDIISILRIMAEMFVNALQRKRVEEALSNSEKKYRNLVETSQDLIWSVDVEGRFTFVNQAAKRIYGYEPRETIGRCLTDFVYTELESNSAEASNSFIDRLAVDSSSNSQWEMVHRRRDGTPVYLSFNAIALWDEFGNFQGATGTASDITEHKQSETELKQAKDRLQAVLDAVPWLVSWLSSDLRYIGVNRQLAESFNLIPEEFIGREIGFLDTGPDFVQFMRDFFASSKQQISREVDTRVNGQTKYYLIVTQKYDEGKAAVSVGIDISDRKRAEAMQGQLIASLQESERKFRSLYEATSDAVMLLDEEGFLFDCNRATLEMFSCDTKEELCGKHPKDISPPFQGKGKETESSIKTQIAIALLTGNARFEWMHRRLDGSEFPAEVLLTAMEFGQVPNNNNSNKIFGGTKVLQAVVRDITERKRDEEEIKAALAEKEVLLKEIHHRVKNNLQVISSLLRLQSRYIQDRTILEMLKESQNRVRSMALVHEHLYQSQDLSRIDFAEYIHNLASNLFQAYQVNSRGVKLNIKVAAAFLNIDTAVPCGLIINELVSNSLKYAFKNRNLGELTIEFERQDRDLFLLTVRDNGRGFPPNIDYKNSGSLGLRLVCSLVRQLRGNIELQPGCGTVFKISFPSSL